MATKTQKAPNKTAFVRDFITQNPQANRNAVEEAWRAAGHEGLISSALVSNLRSELGLTGNLRSGSRTAESNGAPESVKATAGRKKSKKRGRGAKGTASRAVAEPIKELMPRSVGRDGALVEIEGDIDHLIFKLIALGGMETIEEELRKVRRLLYRSYSV
jgi:hypothetical protein